MQSTKEDEINHQHLEPGDKSPGGATALDSTIHIEDEDCPAEEISKENLEAMTRVAKKVIGQPSSETETPSESEVGEKKGTPVGEEVVIGLVSIAEEFGNSVTKFSNAYKNMKVG